MKLDFVLGLKIEDFLERRLQTQVFKLGLARSIHHARVLIRQRHIRVRKQMVNCPGFLVRLDSGKHIEYSTTSPYGCGRPGKLTYSIFLILQVVSKGKRSVKPKVVTTRTEVMKSDY